ncbi:hypothetical protein NBO_177g0001 [Nosema bombycis CQ1]|uniref:Uncharacterized protein n=1 Tax=Nosema bombycis (strain CQ1 / CVCC 102059) TaxID=578461 RepID=R0KSB3_NOSB1|nr:hypothetical protein NBO_177g0001 [Nosema bombycis CQ1]|eukprot:EOB13107.1 hypothetical protein NBO_177g0001 [Nosema bombycis CQ1]
MNLLNDLKNENISSLFSSLLIAVKDFGSDECFGFISLVLLMTSSDMNGKNTNLKGFLVYSIAFFWCLALVECRENIDLRVLNSWELKSKLYKMILKCFCPSSCEIKYKKNLAFVTRRQRSK